MSPLDAESTSLLVVRLGAALDAQLRRLQETCEPQEFSEQRRLFGAAMSALLDIANPIHRDYPHLKPVQMGGSFDVPAWVLKPLPLGDG
jgi:hypothetical protein